MRRYSPKDNAQKQVRFSNKFQTAPQVARESVEDGTFFATVIANLQNDGIDIIDSYIELNQLVIKINPEQNYATLKSLKESSCFRVCSELSAVDYLAKDGEFEVFYQMLNLDKALRARVETRIKQNEAIESIVPLFAMANFAEREMYDMFGIVANNHPELKRILMPEDWVGHPLLKTYPLQGDEAASWYEVDKIFGKEYRDVVGPEIRDTARIDRYDTKRFARVGKEVPFGADPELVDEAVKSIEDGYSKTFMANYKSGSKTLEKKR